MLISIIIPFYNVEDYIIECLESVISQTYTGQLECILIDDCGTDNSANIVNDFILHYKGNIDFRVVRHHINLGISAARNTGIKASKGDYIFYLDSDDWITPNCIETIVIQLKKYPQSDLIISSAESSNEWVKREALVGRPDIPEYTEDRMWVMNGLLSRPVLFHLSPWNKLISKNFILKNNLFFLEGFVREDEIWCFHCAKVINSVAFCKKCTYHYRVSPMGIVHSNEEYSSAELSLRIVNHYLDNITSFGKEIQLKLVSTMLLDVYIKLHNNKQVLAHCKQLFFKLFQLSPCLLKLGCIIMIYVPHKLVCKRPVYLPTKHFLFGIEQ